MHRIIAYSRAHRLLVVSAVLVVLATLALRAFPVSAQTEDPNFPIGTVQVRFSVSMTTYVAPDPAAAVHTVLAAYSVVDKVGAVIGKDGQVWVQVRTPGGESLGYMTRANFITGALSDPVFIFFPF
jgi:hypothetical protein